MYIITNLGTGRHTQEAEPLRSVYFIIIIIVVELEVIHSISRD